MNGWMDWMETREASISTPFFFFIFFYFLNFFAKSLSFSRFIRGRDEIQGTGASAIIEVF